MAKIWDKPITADTDWGGDASTNGLPVSGRQVQAWIKANIKSEAELREFIAANAKTLEPWLKKWIEENGITSGGGGGNFGDLIQYDEDLNALVFKANAIINGGVAWNSSTVPFDAFTITQAVDIDNHTIKRANGTTGPLYVDTTVIGGSGGGGVADSVSWKNVTGKPTNLAGYGITDVYTIEQTDKAINDAFDDFAAKVSDDNVVNTYKELIDYAAEHGAEFTALVGTVANKADKATSLAGYGIKDAYTKTEADGKFIDFTTDDQTISGKKNFENGLKIGGKLITYDADKEAFVIPSSVVIEGGIAWNTSIDDFDYDVTHALNLDPDTLEINEAGQLTVIGGVGGLDENELANYLTDNGYATKSWVESKKYITGIDGNMVVHALTYTPFNKADFTKSNIKITLGISDWALKSTLPTASEVGALAATATAVDSDKLGGKAASEYFLKSGGTVNGSITATSFIGDLVGNADSATTLKTAKGITYAIAYNTDKIFVFGENAIANGYTTYLDGKNIYMRYGTKSYVGFSLLESGNVAIGGSTADAKLTVHGDLSTQSVKVNGATITYDSTKNAFVLPANVVIEGGVAWNSSIEGFTPKTIMDALSLDPNALEVNSAGQLTVKGGAGGGVSESWVSDNFLSKAGGKVNGVLTIAPSNVSGVQDGIVLHDNGLGTGEALQIRWKSSDYSNGVCLYGAPHSKKLYFNDGDASYTVIHSGNYSSYCLPLAGGKITGILNLDGSTSSNSRATIQLVSSADQPNDLLFGAKGNAHWSITSRESANSYRFGLYNFKTTKFSVVVGRDTDNVGIGIGNIDPSERLEVSGNVKATKFIGALQGNADSATKLATSRTIWGKYFDGTSNISGMLSEVTSLIFNGGKGLYQGSIYSSSLASDDLVVNAARTFFNGSGGVVIGNTTPSSYKLDVFGSAAFGTSTGCDLWLRRSNGYSYINAASELAFTVGNNSGNIAAYITTDRYAIFNSRVGIGTTAPSESLDVNGNVKARGGTLSDILRLDGSTNSISRATIQLVSSADQPNDLLFGSSGYGHWSLTSRASADKYFFALYNYNTTNYAIAVNRATDNVGIGTTSPSARLDVNGNLVVRGEVSWDSARELKHIVGGRPTFLSLAELGQIKPYRYTWKDGRDSLIHAGGIADEVMEVLPEVIRKGKHLGMDYGTAGFTVATSLTPYVSDHERRIADLEREKEELKREIKLLKRVS